MIPRTAIVRCPNCGDGIELAACTWQMTRAEHAEEGSGILLDMTFYASHKCKEPS